MPTIHIRGNAELILAGYTYARASEGFGKEHDLWTVFDDLKQDFADCPPVRRRPTLRVRWSAGQGNWAKVPWVTFLDERETMTTQRGVYCVYLFRQDMSGMYVTFNQGVTEPKNQQGRIKAHQFLSKRAAELRKLCDGLAESGFRLDDEIDLRADPGLGSDYESSTIAHKFYEADLVPDDEALLEDLEAILRVYGRYLTDEKWAEALDFCRSILYERADFEADEIEYKQEIVREIRAALDPARDTEEFAQHLKKAFVNSHNNLTNWQSHDRFTKWAINNPERSRKQSVRCSMRPSQ
jgi:hypothetical protein